MSTQNPADIPHPDQRGYACPEIFVTTEWLAEHLDDPAVIVVDTDTPEVYAQSHIPRASNPPDNYYKTSLDDRTHIQGPDQFARTMESIGVGDDSTVVAYDRNGGLYSLRLMWALHYYRHLNVKMLDGGFQKWVAEGREVSGEIGSKEFDVRFTPRQPDKSIFASIRDVLDAVKEADATLLDVRTDSEWDGSNKRGGRRGGRVPGAVHLEWVNFHTGGGIPVLKTADELRSILAAHKVKPDKRVITYCQGGIRAAHAYWVLKLLGFENVRNYDASWREWGNDLKVPVENES